MGLRLKFSSRNQQELGRQDGVKFIVKEFCYLYHDKDFMLSFSYKDDKE